MSWIDMGPELLLLIDLRELPTPPAASDIRVGSRTCVVSQDPAGYQFLPPVDTPSLSDTRGQ